MFSEMIAYNYIGLDSKNGIYAQLDQLNDIFSYYLYGYCDILINYEGKSMSDLRFILSEWIDTSSLKELYQMFIGDPLQFIPYSVGLYQMNTMHENFKEALGKEYSLLKFTTILMNQGNSSFEIYQEKIDEYINSLKTN